MTFYENLIHFRLSILLLIIALFSFTNGLQNIEISNNSVNIKIGLISIILSIVSYIYQKNRLKFISIETNENSSLIIKNIVELAEQKKWQIELSAKNSLIIKTERPFPVNRFFISKSGGEKIYVFFKPNKTLVRSVFDFKKSNGFVVSNGENNENEKCIIERIKPTANSRYKRFGQKA